MNHARHKRQDEICLVYVGTYTHGDSEGIYICQLDLSTGELQRIGVAGNVENPSYLAIDAERHRLYAVNELLEFREQPGGGISAFTIDPASGNLSLLNKQNSGGGAPCYLTLDRAGRYLLVANYIGGNVAVIPIGKEGHLGRPTHVVNHSGSGQHPKRQEGPHPHSIIIDSANDFVFVPDLGLDRVMQYRLDRDHGRLSPNQQPGIQVKPGSGPRHMVFHPDYKRAFVVNELSSTITAYEYDRSRGMLKEYQTVSAVPEEYSGTNIAADLHLTPDGRFLFSSNRGHDSITIYSIDPETGWLTLLDCGSSQGKTPRGFAIDPTGNFLLAANQDSDNIVTFRIDEDRGTIHPTGHKAQIPSPVCLKLMIVDSVGG